MIEMKVEKDRSSYRAFLCWRWRNTSIYQGKYGFLVLPLNIRQPLLGTHLFDSRDFLLYQVE
jgi:hypothetical protein